jgi:2-polyprenyl-3-methyl-5-hydroxy-6-metoxy-1,4-benzoquinol methylase
LTEDSDRPMDRTPRPSLGLTNGHCPVCGSGRHAPTHREGEYSYVRCLECELVRLDPLPDRTHQNRLHEAYLPRTREEQRRFDLMSRDVWARAREFLFRQHGRGRLLDVGCGHGAFLARMRHDGWDVHGLEICSSGRAATASREIVVEACAVEDCALPDRSFDAVTAFYVIEHVPDPLAFLRACLRLLVPGGTLYLRFPDTTPLKNLMGRLGIANSLHDSPFHVLDFSPAAMRSTLERVGFAETMIRVGGFTIPRSRRDRALGAIPAIAGQALDVATGGRLLLPGLSKVATARRPTP